VDEERIWMDGRVEGRTFVEAMGMDEDEGWTRSIEERDWRTDGLTNEQKDERLLKRR
jgi:hypothetical protein